MPIKQIQLRGISRTPSDRTTEDGGCDESLNIHVDTTEQAPTLPAEDATNRFGTNATAFLDGTALFIHKGLGYENLIFLSDNSIAALPKSDGEVISKMSVCDLQSEEEVKNVSAVGNTLIICTNQRMEYVLYKEGEYIDLGEQIPIPAIEFRSYHRNLKDAANMSTFVGTKCVKKKLLESFNPSGSGYDKIKGFSLSEWNQYLSTGGDDDQDASYAEIYNDIWDMVKAQIKFVKRKGSFCLPVFARYAVRLYDGSYIYQSVPVLLGAECKDFFRAFGFVQYKASSPTNASSYIGAHLMSIYKAKAYLSEYNIEGWGDIVKAIDIFLSTDIHIPILNSPISGISENHDSPYGREPSDVTIRYELAFTDEDAAIEIERRRDEILSKSNFYRIATFPIDDTAKLVSGYDLMAKKQLLAYDEDLTSQDILIAQPELPDDYRSAHKKKADEIYRYNNKTFLMGLSQEITPGYQFCNGSVVSQPTYAISADEPAWHYKFAFYLRSSSNNSLVVFGRAADGSVDYESYLDYYEKHIPPAEPGGDETIIYYRLYSKPFAWLAYPDPRCYQVDIAYRNERNSNWTYKRYKMDAHPALDCAFLFVGLGKQLGLDGTGETITTFPDEEKRNLTEDNVVWASLLDNPFVFPAEGRITFTDKVVGIGSISTPLSEGQVGDFDLYVFTEDGIRVLSVNRTGDFTSSFAEPTGISRHVALPGTIMSIEGAIIFITERGVMLLSGREVIEISPNMNGRHFTMDNSVINTLANSGWANLANIETDSDTFMAFMRNASIGYDYAGMRLIFFNDNKQYQYVYYLSSQTWHKIYTPYTEYRVLNSYPECMVYVSNQSAPVSMERRLLNFSTILDDADILSDVENTVRGIIVTRPFDLGEPDIRKAIKSVRIRGQFRRNHVQYLLLGSFDSIHWHRMYSLRGGSYKLFRMFILTNLAPTERISWVDVEYDSRMTNKLR